MNLSFAVFVQALVGVLALVLCVLLLKFRHRAVQHMAACMPRQHEMDAPTRESFPDMLLNAQSASEKRSGEDAAAEQQIAKIKAGEPWIHE